MDWKKYFRTISFLTVLLMTACSNTNTATATVAVTSTSTSPAEIAPATATPVAPPTQTISSATASTSLCANPYYPMREGATWTYQSTGSPADDFLFTETITSVRADGFTLTTEYEKFTRTQEWTCSSEGLLAMQLGGPIVAALQSQSIQPDLKLKNSSGITFPHNIAQGDTWQHRLEFEGDMNIAGEEGVASGMAQGNFSALGMERVSVPAGDYDAMKIQVQTVVTLNVTYEGLTVPVTYTATYDYWFAQDIGWVKATGSANMAGQNFTENIELQSYNVP